MSDAVSCALAGLIRETVAELLEEHRAAIRADIRRALAELRADADGPDQAAYDARGAAAYIGVSLRTIARMRADGRLPAVRVGRQVRYRKRDLDEYLAENLEQEK